MKQGHCQLSLTCIWVTQAAAEHPRVAAAARMCSRASHQLAAGGMHVYV